MATKRFIPISKLVKGPNGRNCCRYCGTEVKPPKLTFCSAECVHEYSVRRSASYARSAVLKRDHGVCSECGLDTEAARREFRDLDREYKSRFAGAPYFSDRSTPASMERIAEMRSDGWPANFHNRLTWWDADHINPVVEGGGGCGLDNLRTLCLRCHAEATRRLRKRMAGKDVQPEVLL